jgi:hypothetical protein
LVNGYILGFGEGYNMMHKNDSGLSYLPEGLKNINFLGSDEEDIM